MTYFIITFINDKNIQVNVKSFKSVNYKSLIVYFIVVFSYTIDKLLWFKRDLDKIFGYFSFLSFNSSKQ